MFNTSFNSSSWKQIAVMVTDLKRRGKTDSIIRKRMKVTTLTVCVGATGRIERIGT